MTDQTGNSDPRVAAAITAAIDLEAKGNVEEAIALLSALAEEVPNAASVHGYLAWFLLQVGQCDAALVQGRYAVDLAPQSENASLVYFFALWKSERRVEALDEMKRFLSLRPSAEYARIIDDWQFDVRESQGND